jgi:hypothetical protein
MGGPILRLCDAVIHEHDGRGTLGIAESSKT